MKIKVLPAINGDCILLEYNTDHYALIDGGYVDTFNTYLRPELSSMSEKGLELDFVVVTHIDSDHISGILKLLEEKSLIISIQNIWYNAYRHIQSPVNVLNAKESFQHHNICKEKNIDFAKPVSAKQGSTLAALIQKNGVNWNSPFNGNPVSEYFGVELANAKIHILSPSADNLKQLRKFWVKELIKKGLLDKEHSEEYWDDAFDFYLDKDKPGFRLISHPISTTIDFEKIKSHQYQPDTSPTNGSSISFIMEVEDKRILMMGDAHAETIVNNLRKLYGEQNAPYSFDAIKLSHHGSFNNNSPELIGSIDSDNWIISTNGDTYNHPDIETLAHIITKGGVHKRRLIFNYMRPVCKILDVEDLHAQYDFEIITPDSENKTTIITL